MTLSHFFHLEIDIQLFDGAFATKKWLKVRIFWISSDQMANLNKYL
jgi:hypothetical protein